MKFTPTVDASEFAADVTASKTATCVTSEMARDLECALRINMSRLIDALATLDRCPKGEWAKTYIEDTRPRIIRALGEGDRALLVRSLPWDNRHESALAGGEEGEQP